jgi:uncharacterized cofD-like protein
MKKPTQNKKILTLGGGSGHFALLSALKDLTGVDITAVVSMFDSGGSTGRLRDELGVLPPGDILKCILALSPYGETARAILLKRFMQDRRLQGHSAGNMLLTMLNRYTGSFPRGVQALAEILDVQGRVLPVTVANATLVAQLADGKRIYGEKAIDIPVGNQRAKIEDVFLVPHHGDTIAVYPPVIDAIDAANYILIGPGDIYTSIVPALIVPKVKQAIQKSKANVIYLLNIMTKFGETHNFKAADFVQTLEAVLERKVDAIVYNKQQPKADILAHYASQRASFVALDNDHPLWRRRNIYEADLLSTSGDIVRHDSRKLARLLEDLIFRN